MKLRGRSNQGRFAAVAEKSPAKPHDEGSTLANAKPTTARRATTSQATPAKLIAVWSPIGSHGRSTVSASIADLLGQGSTGDAKLLLVDADTKAPSQHTLHGLTELTAGVLAAGRLARLDRYSADEHERLTVTVRGYELLTGIQSIERWSELDEHACNRMFTALRHTAGTLVVDLADELDPEPVEPSLGIRRNQLAVSVLAQAEVIVLVCMADPVALSRLPEALKSLDALLSAQPVPRSHPRVIVAINRMRDSAIGSGARQQIQDYLDTLASAIQFDVVFIPDDSKSCDSALQAGEVVSRAHPRSAFSRAVRGLVAQINSTHVHTSRAR